jgi:hypothetical protein
MKTVNNTFGVTFYLKKQKATQAGKAPIYAKRHFTKKKSKYGAGLRVLYN